MGKSFSNWLPLLIFLSIFADIDAQWIKTNFPTISIPISSLVIASDNKIIVGVSNGSSEIIDYGPFSSSDHGATWTEINIGYPNYSIKSLSSCGNNRIVMCDQNNAHYSNDNGKNWSTFTLGIEDKSNILADGIVLPNNTILIGGVSSWAWIARSIDDGKSWDDLNIGYYASLMKLTVSNNNTIFALTGWYEHSGIHFGTEYIIRSTDNGNSWKEVFHLRNYTYDFEWFTSLSCDHNGNVFVSSDKGLYRSTDNGNNWKKIDSLSNHTNFKNFAYNKTGSIYANNNKGIFKSLDNGNIWNLIEPTDQVQALGIDDDGYLYVGTVGLGIIRSAQTTTSVSEPSEVLPKQFVLSQNYPNPFNPSTVINYKVPKTSHVQLIVYDLLGREVATLINKEQSPGSYKVEFDGRRTADRQQLPTGIYFYRLTADNFSQTKKMILLK